MSTIIYAYTSDLKKKYMKQKTKNKNISRPIYGLLVDLVFKLKKK